MASAIKIIAGLFIILIGFPIFIGGTAILIITPVFADDNGYFMTTPINIERDGVAAVRVDIPLDNVQIGIEIDPSKFVTFKMRAHGPNNEDIFAGLTTHNDADSFLASVSYVRITNLEYFEGFEFGQKANYTIEYEENSNTTTWAVPQDTSITWFVGGTSGKEFIWKPTLEQLTGESISLIIMNDNYSGTGPENSSIDIYFSFGAKIPILNAIGWILVVFGGLLTILGIILLWSGFRSKKPRTERVRYYYGAPTQRVEPIERPTPKYQLQCSNCGSLNEPDSAFCSQCGEVLLSEDRKTVDSAVREKEAQIFEPTGTRLVVAEWGPRFWAFLIDMFIISAITSIFSSLLFFSIGDWSWWSFGIWSPFQWLFSLGPSSGIFFLYNILMENYYGQTLGKMALNLEIVSERTGERPTIGELIISAFGKAFLLPIDLILGRIIKDEAQIPDLNQRATQKWARTVVIQKETKKEKTAQFVSGRV
jgi:uncharacterized RDD family membrane protein YckC